MRKVIRLETTEDVKMIETVSKRVSKKYVPIMSTELIALMEPEFKFVGGTQIRKGSTKHYIDLDSGDDHLRIYNSYDRTMALRVNLVSDGMVIPLGVDRLVHIGQKAKDFTVEFTEAKDEIKEAIKTAKLTDFFLKDNVITVELAKTLTEAIFQHGTGKKINQGITDIRNFTDILIDQKISIKKYITLSVRAFLTGEYTYIKNGKKLNGRKKEGIMRKVKIENRVIKALTDEYPEYFL